MDLVYETETFFMVFEILSKMKLVSKINFSCLIFPLEIFNNDKSFAYSYHRLFNRRTQNS